MKFIDAETFRSKTLWTGLILVLFMHFRDAGALSESVVSIIEPLLQIIFGASVVDRSTKIIKANNK